MKNRKILAISAGIALAALLANSATMPDDIRQQLSKHLPAAIVPMPASGANKIFPLVSEKRKSADRKYAIKVGEQPYAITAIGEDGSIVEMSVPAGLHTEEFSKRWFKTEDVFGKIKWKLEEYSPDVPCLAYFSGGKGPLELVAKIQKGTTCASLGTIAAGKAKRRLVQVRVKMEASGLDNEFMIAFPKENPPVETPAQYKERAKQLFAEHAFREGRPWGKAAPSLLGNSSCTECAAMAADFATYMFDGALSSGEMFDKADEIRDGDVIKMESHFFAVVYRKGSQLTTIEGNMNKCVSRSTSRYSVKDGKLLSGGKDAGFVCGYHNWSKPEK